MPYASRLLQAGTFTGLLYLLLTPSLCMAKIAADHCLQQAMQAPETAVNLKTECPDLFAQLEAHKLIDSFKPAITDEISLVQLNALNEVLQDAQVNWQLDQQGLVVLLNNIRLPDNSDPTEQWWTQLMTWLKSFEPGEYEVEFRWILDLINTLIPSENAVELMTKITIYCLIAISLGLVIWELYLAGVFNRFGLKHKLKPTGSVNLIKQKHSPLELTDITRLQPIAQVSALLNLAIYRLTTEHQLPDDPSLTNAELIAYLQQHHAAKTSYFSKLVGFSEPVLYGQTQADQTLLQLCWQQTRLICSDRKVMP